VVDGVGRAATVDDGDAEEAEEDSSTEALVGVAPKV
jgi:hypothetical protein